MCFVNENTMSNNKLQFDTRGLEKFSLVEWPGKITAIIFTGGCNFRCPFCHNPEIVTELEKTPEYPWEEIEKFLDQKVGWVDAIMITGGEPTIQPDLPAILKLIKEKGFLTGIATNGSNPEMLKNIIEKKLVDRVCMDVKSSLEKYPEACGSKANVEKIKESIELIKNSPIEYEFKLTLVPGLVNKEDISKIGELVKGAKKITLQQFRPLKSLDKSYESKVPYGKDDILQMAKVLEEYVDEVNLDFID
jgi:pyruvate formate lyase activating enzyme